MQAHITLLWTEASDSDLAALEDAAKMHEITVARASRNGLASSILAALARGAVIVAATTDQEATRALGLGVDEVVRLGPLSASSIARCVQRARARADARSAREAIARREAHDDGMALTLMAAAIGHELNNPLLAASASVDALNEGLGGLLESQEKLVGWAFLAAPVDECQRITQQLAAVPNAGELRSILADLNEAVARATHVMRTLVRLSREEGDLGSVKVSDVVKDVRELLQGEMGRWTELEVDIVGESVAAVSRPAFVCMLGALLAHALDAVRAVARADAHVVLRASEHDGAVLVEVEHNGRSVPSDLRPNMFEPYFRNSTSTPNVGLEGVRERARRLGGELLVSTDRATTTLRLVVPAVERPLEGVFHIEGETTSAAQYPKD